MNLFISCSRKRYTILARLEIKFNEYVEENNLSVHRKFSFRDSYTNIAEKFSGNQIEFLDHRCEAGISKIFTPKHRHTDQKRRVLNIGFNIKL